MIKISNNDLQSCFIGNIPIKKIYKGTDLVYESVNWYGIRWRDGNPTCERIGNLDYHVSLPIQNKMRRCMINSITGDIKYINDDNPVDFNKYPFSLIDSTLYYDKRLDTQIVSIPYIKSEYDALIKNETDYLFSDIYKTDYLGGITYKPKVENDVRIERGNYMAFERHLKLAEIKTMEDMENYSNNSFFNVQKVS